MKSILFTNECKIDESWMSEAELSFRNHANNYISQVVDTSNLFSKNTEIHVTYFQEGVGSIVAKIEQEDNRIYVFKMIKSRRKTNAEIFSYKKYHEIGISAPEIYESGEVGEYMYYVMEHFGVPTYRELIEKGEVSLKEVGEYMGMVLFQLETISTRGFGVPENEENGVLVGGTLNLHDYLQTEFNKPEYAKLHGEYLGVVDWQRAGLQRIERLEMVVGDHSVLGNFDFDSRHFFVSHAPVLFDPDAELVPEYFSAAFYCSPEMGYPDWRLELRRKVMSSYKVAKGSFDKDTFTSALWLLVYRKCFRLLSLPNARRVARAIYMLDILADDVKLELHVKNTVPK